MSAERYLRWDHRGPRGRQQSLLWPVEVWTILAPDANRRLNVFQEAILGLLRTGMRDRQQIAKLLGLEDSLVAFVLAHELLPAGWVDGQFRPTPAGEDLLSGGIDTQGAPSVQYAYRDSVFGLWLPRVSSDLPDVYPLEMGAQRFPTFRESREGGGEVRPFLLPRRQGIATPAKADILKAWRAGLRDALQANGDEEGVPEIRSDDIEILGDKPTLAYVWCEVIHVPGDLHSWLVTDPWRITPAARWLREPLQASLDSIPALAHRISALLPTADASVLSADELSRQIERDVELHLSRWPALDKPSLSELKHHLGRVLRQKARTETLEKATQEELASLVQECGSLLEALVQWMLERWPAGERVWPRDGQNRGAAEALLDAVPLRAPLPERSKGMLAGQNFRDIRLAAKSRDRPFKALLFAALLSTHGHLDHPLRELEDTQVQWERLLDLIGMRNKGAHASGRRLLRGDALSEAEFAIAWFENFSKYF